MLDCLKYSRKVKMKKISLFMGMVRIRVWVGTHKQRDMGTLYSKEVDHL
jgi:hypothetical protein